MARSKIVLTGEYEDVPGVPEHIKVYLKSLSHGEFTFQMHRGSPGMEFDTTVSALRQSEPDEAEPLALQDGVPIYRLTPSNVEKVLDGANQETMCAYRVYYKWNYKGGMPPRMAIGDKIAWVIAKVRGLDPDAAVESLKNEDEEPSVATT